MNADDAGRGAGREWWQDAVVYQVYPRSFQDSDGDGIGDLAGIASRLDHLEWLGVDAVWLSPVYPSPMADSGYDVADYRGVDPLYGTLADLDGLIAACHARGIRVLLDLVVSHTSIEHPWFREHPDWYVWADDGPPNNWLAAFGGPAWSRDERTGRFYLHSFYPEQPDLDWRNPEVRGAIAEVVGFWRDRGVDGFRVDAVDRLMKDVELRDEPLASRPFPLPLPPERARLAYGRSGNDPEIGLALGALKEAAGRAPLVGEVYLPNEALESYLEHLDLVFSFEVLFAPWDAAVLRRAIGGAAPLGRVAWVLSNHDFPRLATRLGAGRARAAAVMLLTLPGAAFIYQGDEIGMPDGRGGSPPLDRAGRDRHRHPMQWEPGPGAGFSSAAPWLAPIDPGRRSVAAQRADPRSLLWLYRRLIGLRPELGAFRLLGCEPGLIAYERGAYTVAINASRGALDSPARGELVLASSGRLAGGEDAPARLAPGDAVIVRDRARMTGV